MSSGSPNPASSDFSDFATGPVTPPSQRSNTPPPIPDHELLHRIGAGSYGEVWLARSATGSYCAVKVVYRSSFDNDRPYQREFEGLKKFEPISHARESQVDIFHVGINPGAGYFYYIMELADPVGADAGYWIQDGEGRSRDRPIQYPVSSIQHPASYVPRTLKHDLRTRGALPFADCVSIALSLIRALEHLHTNGLVHRDIKPSNIIFVNGVPKLADIGLVTSIDATRSFVGTDGYIPPEGPGSPAGDLYSLGKVLYEAVTGKDRLDFPELPADWRGRADFDSLLEFNEILTRTCDADPGKRHHSSQEMAADLALLQRGRSVRQKRAVEQRVAIAKKIALAIIVLASLITALPLVKALKQGKAPNPEVKRLYDLGHWHHSQLTAEDAKKAVKYLNGALQIDPRFVPAYVELFEIYIWTFPGVAGTRQEQLRKTREIADKLLAIDHSLGEGHAALSYRKYLERDWRGAEAEIQRAIQLNPDYAMAHSVYGYYLSLLGRADEALREARRAQELDSASSRVTALVGWYPFMAGRQFDRAIAQLKLVLELDKKFSEAHRQLGWCYEAQANYLAAIEEYKAADLESGEDPAKTEKYYAALREAFDTKGESGYWQKNLELARPDESLEIAESYAKLGDKEKALEVLEKRFDEMTIWNALKFDPLLDSLHDELRFKALLKRAGLEK